MIKYISIILSYLMFGNTHTEKQNDIRPYLALGDSYTIGESVEPPKSFPYQLSSKFGPLTVMPKIIAKTGWTTQDLLEAIEREKPQHDYELVTLLIGVNNQYRGYSTVEYRRDFQELLQIAIACAGGRKNRVFVISIPDWGVTDYATQNGFNKQTIANQIDEYNSINKQETLAMGVSYTDITSESRKAQNDKTLIASDGLHPSGKMYADWVNLLYPKIKPIID